MAKIALALVFTLVVVVPLHSVLCNEDDQDAWMNLIEQAKSEASKAGVSADAIFEAQKVIGDAATQKAAEDVFGGGSLSDWVQKAKDVAKENSGIPPTSPDDEEEDNLSNAPTSSPTEAPAAAPQAQSPSPSPF